MDKECILCISPRSRKSCTGLGFPTSLTIREAPARLASCVLTLVESISGYDRGQSYCDSKHLSDEQSFRSHISTFRIVTATSNNSFAPALNGPTAFTQHRATPTSDLRHIYDRNHGRHWKPRSPDHPLRLCRRIRFRRLPGSSPLLNSLICSPLADHKTDTPATDVRLDQRPRRPRKEKDGKEECQVLERRHAGWSEGD